MKTMTCRQLGGACDLEFRGNTFEEIMAKSKAHGREMFQQQDEAHLKAMQEIRVRMQSPETMQEWLEIKRRQFEKLKEQS